MSHDVILAFVTGLVAGLSWIPIARMIRAAREVMNAIALMEVLMPALALFGHLQPAPGMDSGAYVVHALQPVINYFVYLLAWLTGASLGTAFEEMTEDLGYGVGSVLEDLMY